jgi:hypothetical protein
MAQTSFIGHLNPFLALLFAEHAVQGECQLVHIEPKELGQRHVLLHDGHDITFGQYALLIVSLLYCANS